MEIAALLFAGFPLLVFLLAFRSSWLDRKLSAAAWSGVLFGIMAYGVMKWFAYPVVNFSLGIDIRNFIVGDSEIWVRFLALVFLVGCLEEMAKLIAALLGLAQSASLTRPPAVFLSLIGSALGFSVLENLDYLYSFGVSVILPRIIVSTPGHLIFSGTLAVFLASSLYTRKPRTFSGMSRLMFGFAVASVGHGVFNLMAVECLPSVSFAFLVAGSLCFGVLLFQAWINLLILDIDSTDTPGSCRRCAIAVTSPGRFCPSCGRRLVKLSGPPGPNPI